VIDWQPLDPAALELEAAEPFRHMVPESFWSALQGQDPWKVADSKILAVAAFSNDKPIGLALATLRIYTAAAELLCLYVDEEYRHQGIGRRGLAALQSQVWSARGRWLACVYPSEGESAAAMEALFRTFYWDNPTLFLVRMHFLVQEFNPYWMAREWATTHCQLPKGSTLSLWSNVTEAELQNLDSRQEQGYFPPAISKEIYRGSFEPINSMVLRDEGQIVGWMITQAPDPQTIQYASFYIDPKYRHTGYAVVMLAESIRLQKQSTIPMSLLEINVQHANHNWLRFAKRYLIPYASSVERFNRAVYSVDRS
jgi:GNAT superfamily N-acetyltransferase